MMDETPGSQRAESGWNVGVQFHGCLVVPLLTWKKYPGGEESRVG